MAVWLISGDASMVSLELTALVDRLVGDDDRSMIVEDFDCADSALHPGAIVDALTTSSLFSSRRVVVVRNAHELDATVSQAVAAGVDSRIEGADLVITGKPPKSLADACKRAGAETVGTATPTRANDRIGFVEAKFVEAGFTYSADAARLVATWFGDDLGRMSGLIATLLSAYGEGAKLSRSDIEAFLGEAGAVKPWDLTDAIDRGDVNGSLTMLHRMMGPGDSHPLQILSLLANRYAQMMKLDGRGVRTVDDAVSILGGKPFMVGKVLTQYQRLGSGGVAKAVGLIAAADIDLRGGKDWDAGLVMEVLVARLAALAGAQRATGATTSRR